MTANTMAKEIKKVFDVHDRALSACPDLPVHAYLHCMIVITMRTAMSLCRGDEEKAVQIVSAMINEAIKDKLHTLPK